MGDSALHSGSQRTPSTDIDHHHDPPRSRAASVIGGCGAVRGCACVSSLPGVGGKEPRVVAGYVQIGDGSGGARGASERAADIVEARRHHGGLVRRRGQHPPIRCSARRSRSCDARDAVARPRRQSGPDQCALDRGSHAFDSQHHRSRPQLFRVRLVGPTPVAVAGAGHGGLVAAVEGRAPPAYSNVVRTRPGPTNP